MDMMKPDTTYFSGETWYYDKADVSGWISLIGNRVLNVCDVQDILRIANYMYKNIVNKTIDY